MCLHEIDTSHHTEDNLNCVSVSVEMERKKNRYASNGLTLSFPLLSNPSFFKNSVVSSLIITMASSILEVFWDLAVLDPAVRMAAAAKLVRHLVSMQESQPGLNEELAYCVKRLVKGLSSSRLAARQGFSVALIEVLISLPVVRA